MLVASTLVISQKKNTEYAILGLFCVVIAQGSGYGLILLEFELNHSREEASWLYTLYPS